MSTYMYMYSHRGLLLQSNNLPYAEVCLEGHSAHFGVSIRFLFEKQYLALDVISQLVYRMQQKKKEEHSLICGTKIFRVLFKYKHKSAKNETSLKNIIMIVMRKIKKNKESFIIQTNNKNNTQ